MRTDLILEDTTLRDGEQAPGLAFSKQQKFRIHDALAACGVRWIEAGIAAMGGEELEFLNELLARGSDATLVGWNRGVREDVERSIGMGFRAVHIGLPTSDLHLKESVRRDRKWLLEQAATLIALAKDRGVFVSISAEDVGRTEIPFLQEYAGVVAGAGADRLRLSDTIGILTPEQYAERVAAVRQVTDIDLQCHTHNDFGLAVANTLAGLRAGARYFHVTVNAIGERAGMPDLAQAVMALKRLYGIDLGIDTTRLTELSRIVAEVCGTPLPPWSPVVGANVFAHESGIHAKGTLANARTFEAMLPEDVGGVRRIVLGKHSGRAGIEHALREQGIDVRPELLPACLVHIREESIRRGGAVPDERAVEIYRSLENSIDDHRGADHRGARPA